MTRSTSLHVPDLRDKIDLACVALELSSDQAFAEAIGVRPPTLSGYMQGARNLVPRDRVEAMARLLAERLPGRLSLDHARMAWLGDLGSFRLAIAPYPNSSFGTPLDHSPLSVPISLHLRPGKRTLALQDDEAPLDPGVRKLPAESRFDLELKGPPGVLVVVLAQSMLGWHFAIPRTPAPVQIDKSGKVRAPERGLRFPKDGGRYVFHAFLVEVRAAAVPSIMRLAGEPSPLSAGELDQFAVELKDPLRTKAFRIGRLAVFVETAA